MVSRSGFGEIVEVRAVRVCCKCNQPIDSSVLHIRVIPDPHSPDNYHFDFYRCLRLWSAKRYEGDRQALEDTPGGFACHICKGSITGDTTFIQVKVGEESLHFDSNRCLNKWASAKEKEVPDA